jgi:hypothetical protein
VTTTHDFDDGHGPQPAARHHNPDGSEGGWVAATASVSSSATLDESAIVFGRARIEDGCDVGYFGRVYGDARMESGARVEGAVHVCDRARLTRTASMYGNSAVMGDAVLSGTMFGYTTLGGDSVVAEGVRVLPLAWILNSGRIEANHHYFCGFGGPVPGHWTFYRGEGTTPWLCLARSDARPVEAWVEHCDKVGAGLVNKHVSAPSLRRFLEFALSLEVVRAW